MSGATLRIDGHADLPIDPAATHRGWLRDHHISLDWASELWRAFVNDLPDAPQGDIHPQSPDGVSAAAIRLTKYHCSAALATSTKQRLRRLYQATLPPNGKYLNAQQRLLTPPLPIPELVKDLRGAAAAYPNRLKGSRTLDEVTTFIAAIDKRAELQAAALQPTVGWARKVLSDQQKRSSARFADDGGSAGPLPLNISGNCALHLLMRVENPVVPGRDLARELAFDGEDPLDEFSKEFVNRKFAYATDPEDSGADTATNEPQPSQLYLHTLNRLAALINHPWLAKLFGLTFDMRLAHPDVRVVLLIKQMGVSSFRDDTGLVSVETILATQMTAGFPKPLYARGAQAAYHDGVLDVSEAAGFMLTDIDVDRTPDRYMQAAIAHLTQVQVGASEQSTVISMASQETTGLSLIEFDAGRKQKMLQPNVKDEGAIDRGAQRSGRVYLEHLLVGYRPDVRDSSVGSWRSLSVQRLKRVTLDGRDITGLFSRIGPSEALLAERTRKAEVESEAGMPTAHFLEGELFRWSVWGIGQEPAAPHNKPMPTEHIGDSAPNSVRERLSIEYESHDVPSQRYGRLYRFGVRLAMADGNSLSIDEAAQRYAEHACTIGDESTSGDASDPGMPMLRMESVLPPRVLLRDALDRYWFPRESGRYVVVASGAGRTRTRRLSERVLVPPRTANLETCIRHGVLDEMLDRGDWPASAFSKVERTKDGNFPLVSVASDADATTPKEQQFRPLLVGSSDGCKPPYYPDPIARVAVLAFYREGDDALLVQHVFDHYDGGNAWPDCVALRLKVRAAQRVASPVGIDVHVHSRGMDVSLAPGVHVKLRTFYRATGTDLLQAGVVRQASVEPSRTDTTLRANTSGDTLTRSAASVEHDAVALNILKWANPDRVVASRMDEVAHSVVMDASVWMMNPYEELTLKHAVDQPIRSPFLVDHRNTPTGAQPFKIHREPGESRIEFEGHLWLDRPSTGRIDAIAHWMDNPVLPAPTSTSAHYLRRPSAVSQTFFSLTDIAIVPLDDSGTPANSPQAVQLPPSASLQRLERASNVTSQGRTAKRIFAPVHDVGDTRARVIDMVLNSVSRDVGEYAELAKSGNAHKSAARPMVLEGTARPMAPVVDYVMPLLHWTSGDMPADLHRRTREAGWFRIWLGREWYQSGDGELLALLFWQGPIHTELEPWTTQWGLDPTFDERLSFTRIHGDAFGNRLRTMHDVRASGGPSETLEVDEHHLAASDLSDIEFAPKVNLCDLPEHQDLSKECGPSESTVELALYRPLLDPESGRMFVDVRLNAGDAYMPFVRLAMARYQPLAQSKLRLSTVVASEFAQLMPERSLSLSILPGSTPRRKIARVVLVGPAALVPRPERSAWWRAASSQESQRGDGVRHTQFRATIEFQKFGVAHGADADNNGAWIPANGAAEDIALTRDEATGTWSANIEFDHQTSRTYSVRIEEVLSYADDEGTRGKNPIYFDRILMHF